MKICTTNDGRDEAAMTVERYSNPTFRSLSALAKPLTVKLGHNERQGPPDRNFCAYKARATQAKCATPCTHPQVALSGEEGNGPEMRSPYLNNSLLERVAA
jgi:hypothetical protein